MHVNTASKLQYHCACSRKRRQQQQQQWYDLRGNTYSVTHTDELCHLFSFSFNMIRVIAILLIPPSHQRLRGGEAHTYLSRDDSGWLKANRTVKCERWRPLRSTAVSFAWVHDVSVALTGACRKWPVTPMTCRWRIFTSGHTKMPAATKVMRFH